MTLCLTISSLGITEATTPVLTPAPSHPGGEENAHPHHPHPSPSPFPVTLSRPAVPIMEYIQIVQRPPFSHRPYGLLRSPYTEHPTCSVLCHHPTAPHTHRSLIHLTRASWLAEVRAHMSRAGAALAETDLETGDRRTPSSLPFTPWALRDYRSRRGEEKTGKIRGRLHYKTHQTAGSCGEGTTTETTGAAGDSEGPATAAAGEEEYQQRSQRETKSGGARRRVGEGCNTHHRLHGAAGADLTSHVIPHLTSHVTALLPRRVIRYTTHSCIDPSRRRRVVRRPGVLVYCKRSALISARLRKRRRWVRGRGKKRKPHYHLLLPPPARRRHWRRKRVCQTSQEPRNEVKLNRASHESLARYLNKRQDRETGAREVGAVRAVRRPQGRRQEFPTRRMPINEWKIVLRDKTREENGETQMVTPGNCNAGATAVTDETRGAHHAAPPPTMNPAPSTTHPTSSKPLRDNKYYSPPRKIEIGREINTSLPDTQTSWCFPVLPGRCVERRGSPLRSSPRAATHHTLRFEVVVEKARLHHRFLKGEEPQHVSASPWSKPMSSDCQVKNSETQTKERFSATSCTATTTQLKLLPLKQSHIHLRDIWPTHTTQTPKTNQNTTATICTTTSCQQTHTKSEGDESKPVTSLNTKDREERPSSSTSIGPYETVREAETEGHSVDCPDDQQSARESPGVYEIDSPDTVPLTRATLKAKEKFMRPLRGRDRTDLSQQTESETESEMNGAMKKRKKRRRKTRGRQTRRNKTASHEKDPNVTELTKTDIFSNDIISELLKLYVPRRQRKKQQQDEEDAKRKRSKRRRKRKKGSTERSKEQRNDLLVSLNRNTAFWYDVTSRLTVVSQSRNDPSTTSTLPSLPPTTTTTGRKFRAAVMSLKNEGNLEKTGGREEAEGGGLEEGKQTSLTSSSPRPLPPLSGTKVPSKFYTVASAFVTAEKNYHSLLPPLSPTWSETLDSLFPSLPQASDSVDSGLGGEKQRPKRRSRRPPKKKAEEGGLDDPGQTAVAAAGDSRAASSRLSGSSHSSKPTSARSSKSSSSHRRIHDPLSYHPKQFLGDGTPAEGGAELKRLQETLGGGGGGGGGGGRHLYSPSPDLKARR
ncbi:uncharacterized protein LOC135089965 [Scylla paramamosain]|uniref:uncharacterized protein LOC135089965 n=1 Tax=Scylla paramamosain TaxID=85552 RepID=UPI003083B217